MKSAIRKNFFREITYSKARFLSILSIVVLGVAFFAGIRATEPDMRLTMDEFVKARQYMDISVQSTLGLTEDDLAVIQDVDGVDRAEGAYSVDVLTDRDDVTSVLTVMSFSDDMNLPEVTEGELPTQSDECMVDEALAEEWGLSVGDTITVKSGSDTALSDQLKKSTFTITGMGNSPLYLTENRGNSTIGNGSVTGFLVVTPEAFSMDTYTTIYIRTDHLDTYMTYDEGYKDEISDICDRIEDLEEERCEIRLTDISSEVVDGWAEVKDSEAELEDGRQELEDGKQDLIDGQQELDDQKASAEEQIAEAQQQITDGKSELSSGWSSYYSSKKQLESQEQTLKEKQKELEAGKTKLDSAWSQYNQGVAGLQTLKDSISQIESQISQLESQMAEIQTQMAGLEPESEEYLALQEQYTQLQTQEETLKAQDSSLQSQYTQTSATLDATKKTLDEQQATYDSGKKQIDSGLAQIASGKTQLQAAYNKLVSSESTLASGQEELDSQKATADQKIADAQTKIDDGWAEIEENEQDLIDGEQELADAKEDLADAQADIDALGTGEWYVYARSDNNQFAEYEANAEKIGAIGKVFPIIFFLVAALVSLTSMTRMVEEQRGKIGLLEAMGYGKSTVVLQFVGYCLLASVGGSVIGVIFGEKFLPYFIINAYSNMYPTITTTGVPLVMKCALVGSIAAIGCNLVATLVVCFRMFMSVPAELMRPEAPKKGSKIFLEHITPLWSRLKFSMKAALRNLFRYKKRLVMTIIGISGCTALVVVGYGVRDSVNGIMDRQFGSVWNYDAECFLDTDTDTSAFLKELTDVDHVTGTMDAYQKAVTAESTYGSVGDSGSDVYLIVPENGSEVEEYFTFTDDETDTPMELTDDGVILSSKLAEMLEVSAGDTLTITVEGEDPWTVNVSGVAENYINHFIYMTQDLYEEVSGASYEVNAVFLNMDTEDEDTQRSVVGQLLESDCVLQVQLALDTSTTMDDMIGMLSSIVGILIAAAGLLAFVVIFNLNTISITERKRELATLKVLGFYDGEVSMYVYRENIFLTAVGIVVGLVLGKFLHAFIMGTVETENMQFAMQIKPSSYIMAVLITVVFALIVNFISHFSMKRIDMIESLKSVE